jgi:uncharacterized protein (DUF488 family)
VKVHSIGFTQTTAAAFFARLRGAGVRRLVDVRLNNRSQLAGFSKQDDLRFFLRELCDADYVHEPLLAPEPGMFDDYKHRRGAWDEYAQRFLDLMADRQIERALPRSSFATPTVLLCSEPTAAHCHRRLVLEYLRARWGDLEIEHL